MKRGFRRFGLIDGDLMGDGCSGWRLGHVPAYPVSAGETGRTALREKQVRGFVEPANHPPREGNPFFGVCGRTGERPSDSSRSRDWAWRTALVGDHAQSLPRWEGFGSVFLCWWALKIAKPETFD